MDDAHVVEELTESFSRQLRWYCELRTLTDSALSSIVLSRGNVAAIMPSFGRKRELVDSIGEERARIREVIDLWQKRKAALGGAAGVAELDVLLKETEEVIRAYLRSEQQLQTYLGRLAKRAAPERAP